MTLLVRSLLAAALLGGALAAVRATAQQEQPPEAVEQELREFVPSEKIPAGSAVSFPSDI